MLVIEMIMNLYDPGALRVRCIEPISAVCLHLHTKYVYIHIYIYINLQVSQ